MVTITSSAGELGRQRLRPEWPLGLRVTARTGNTLTVLVVAVAVR